MAHRRPYWLAGIALAGLFFVLSWMSSRFAYEIADLHKPIIPMVLLLVGAGALYLYAVVRLRMDRSKGRLLIWVFMVGLVMRLSLFNSTPMLEDDHYRYLWDGAVLANGFNPYTYPPGDILDQADRQVPGALRQLGRESDSVIKRINYPWVKTIYPPVSQVAFALAHTMAPWSLTAWRIVLLCFDLVSLMLIYLILRAMDMDMRGWVIYWWNPLLVEEIYNSGHMDLLAFPFVLGAILLMLRGRPLSSSGILGIAVGVKIWPVLLLPVFLKPLGRNLRKLGACVVLFTCVATAVLLPQVLSGLDTRSGLRAYGTFWEMNDALFMVIAWAVTSTAQIFRPLINHAQLVARMLAGGILLVWIFFIVKGEGESPSALIRKGILVLAGAFFLSPTQFPWYYLWMLPLLALAPRTALLALTLLLPLYYLRYYFRARGMAHIHDQGIVWLEFVPVWLLLIWEWYKAEGRKSEGSGERGWGDAG